MLWLKAFFFKQQRGKNESEKPHPPEITTVMFLVCRRKCLCPCKHVGSRVYPFSVKHEWNHTIYSVLQLAFLTVLSFRIRTSWFISLRLRAVSSAWNSLTPTSPWLPLSTSLLTCCLSSDTLSCLSKISAPLHFLVPFPIKDFFLYWLYTVFVLFIVCSSTVIILPGEAFVTVIHCQIPGLYNNAWPHSRCSIGICWMNE